MTDLRYWSAEFRRVSTARCLPVRAGGEVVHRFGTAAAEVGQAGQNLGMVGTRNRARPTGAADATDSGRQQ
ncbi:hypothetical protein B9W62_15225 [Streptomyces sp. CS113]|nr:hypothetical protein B9W62_15225 [Streptomyces sp. CS113]